jgi:hypothetical protein
MQMQFAVKIRQQTDSLQTPILAPINIPSSRLTTLPDTETDGNSASY